MPNISRTKSAATFSYFILLHVQFTSSNIINNKKVVEWRINDESVCICIVQTIMYISVYQFRVSPIYFPLSTSPKYVFVARNFSHFIWMRSTSCIWIAIWFLFNFIVFIMVLKFSKEKKRNKDTRSAHEKKRQSQLSNVIVWQCPEAIIKVNS